MFSGGKRALALFALLLISAAPEPLAAQSYRVNPAASTAGFTLSSALMNLEGSLTDYEADLRIISESPLRMKLTGTADLRSIRFKGADDFASLTAGPVLQAITDPEIRIEGEVRKAVRTSKLVFDGTFTRGARRRKMVLPLKLEAALQNRVVISGAVSADLSEIVDDLPFALPDTAGRGTARGRFEFVSATRAAGR
jgi:polyisoprenoid-binding protein YceI